LEESVSKTDLLINATPLQTPALLDELGLSPTILKDKLSVFDLAYDKPPLPLPATVSRISPLEMLVQQAALSYEIWFDRPAPLDIMRSTLSHDSTEGWK
jgi:shikimate dehydrogenase